MRIASLPDFLLQRIERPEKRTGEFAKTTLSTEPVKPVNRQVYQIIREAVLAGMLPVGLQLPSSRDLAKELGMSRKTVTHAYEQLIAEGYIETRRGAGSFIADTVPDQIAELPPENKIDKNAETSNGLSRRGQQLVSNAGVNDLQWGAFMPGVPDVTLFPNRIWSRLQNKVWRRSRVELLTYGQAGGHLPLREAVADYLRVARSVNCTPQQVLITTGIHQSIDLIIKLLGESGDRAWVEDPCYWGIRSVLQSQGIKPVALPVDAEGMCLQAKDLRFPPRFIVVTPSHQYPLGPVMSLSRRRTLLEYAASQQAWIIEDDYDSEFRYGSRPLASLQGMDVHQRVLYMGTFTKTMFPGLRIGFLVVPEALANAFETGHSELYRGGQMFTQAILAEFMREGHFASHIRKMRLLYAERIKILQQSIHQHFGDQFSTSGGEAGLHLALVLPKGYDDVAISKTARARGIVVRPLSRYYMHPNTARTGLLLGYACVPNEQIGPAFDTLASIIKGYTPQ
ncbi:PLP-dependent aminotransferase family protein [Undibacterium sp. Ji67W]|uniref:MocR-like pyridoxine biosynthesis transcription factor PdxR n=1 Tax=Undibacterium sp. Ji67W TaxID=3413042 RepID=UPI003BEF8089